jgi:hypothetical protein
LSFEIGKPQAVVVGFEEWRRLSRLPSFAQLLLAAPLEEGDLPDRNRLPSRDPAL